MLSFGAIRWAAFSIAGLTFLAGCGSAQSSLQPSILAQPSALDSARHASSTELIYAGVKHYIDVYTFPDGVKQASYRVAGSIQAMCSDSKGDVFVAAAAPRASAAESGFVYEYAPQKKAPVATLDLPKSEVPMACASDPTSGNLAVTAQNKRDYAAGIAIYPDASGTPKFYRLDALGANPQAAYDSSGNLFATSGGNVGVELLAGKAAFTKITLAKTLGGVDHVQWDGTYWALQSFDPTKHNFEKLFERIYRVKISGSSGKVVHSVRFLDWPEKDSGQSWITGGTIVATPLSSIVFWAYPAGGKPTKMVHTNRGVKAITISSGG
jgi:hypothetical protein